MNQNLIIAPDQREWLPEDHQCYFVSEVVDDLDLASIYARYDQRRGFSPYEPRMMVKILVYAYCIGVTSSRQIFKELLENVTFRVLAAGNRPDHRTISRFRAQHIHALRGLFQQVLDICKRQGLVPAKTVALDGTKVMTSASMAKNKTKEQLDKEQERLKDDIDRYFAEVERIDKEEDEAEKGKEVRGRKPVQKKMKPARRTTTDPDPRTMSTRNGYVQGYNVQIVVDCSSQVIVACDVFQNGNDKHQLRHMLSLAREGLGRRPKKLLADAGYFSTKEVDGVEGTELFVATKSHEKAGMEEFLPIIELGGRPTTKQAMELLLGMTDGRATYRLRGQTVEPIIGQLKDGGGMREFLMRGLERTKPEAVLASMGNNIKKLWRARMNGGSDRNSTNNLTGIMPVS